MDADILAETRIGKGMHKRKALRLLIAAPRGNYRAIDQTAATYGELTQNEARNILFNEILFNDGTNISPEQSDRIADLTRTEREGMIDEKDY